MKISTFSLFKKEQFQRELYKEIRYIYVMNQFQFSNLQKKSNLDIALKNYTNGLVYPTC